MNKCRFCDSPRLKVFADLDVAPPSNSFLKKEQLSLKEEKYPLKVFVCEKCRLVQLEEFKRAQEIFNDSYAYFSSFSTTWLEHAKKYSDLVTARFGLNETSRVIEIASNDGYLLQYFQKKNIPVLGIEPTGNTAAVAIEKGIQTIVKYFNTSLAKQIVRDSKQADLLIGNNVLAHVPDLNDFVKAMRIILKVSGVITIEFPHLLQLVQHNQFDTIYHEHFSYFSFHTVREIFSAHGLEIFDVEELETHGGSLRIYAAHAGVKRETKAIADLLFKEKSAGMLQEDFYSGFQDKMEKIGTDFLSFLREASASGKKTAGHGAAAKANTLLNYCGVKGDLISFVSDNSPHKQGLFLPGSHIPVVHPDWHQQRKPDYIIIFPWNIKEEIMNQLNFVRRWNARFVIAIPELKIF